LREKKMRKFKSAKHVQRFLSADRAHLRPFSTATTSFGRRGIPCHFTDPLPDLE
jgi:hypothetical protein